MTAPNKRQSPAACRLPLVILSLLLLTIPVLQPLLTDSLTCGYDNTFHLWRAVEVEHLLRQGVIFSRWFPDMALGYGYPLFNFSAPLSAYPPALLHMLGLSWPWALNLTFALGWVLAAWTMYLFAQDHFGPLGGLVAATLYTYVPFHAYDVFYRGGLSQSSAWLFPPLILWALRRADRRLGLTAAALGLGGLILTHNSFALLFAPLFGGYLLIVAHERGWRAVLWGTLVPLLGLGLSAFFWLPALSELDLVMSERIRGAWVFEYANNFLPLGQLLALPRNADPALINDWPARGLGLIPALVAAAGFLALHRQKQRLPVLFFSAALLSCLFLILPISKPLWDRLPLLQNVQFPWRLVGPAALCSAFLAAAAAHALSRLHSQKAGTILICSLVFLLTLPHFGWLYPRHCAPPADTSPEGMIAWERATDTLGSTALGEFLPRWVESKPQENAPLDSLRLDLTSLPDGARILHAEHGPLHATIELQSPQPFRARYLAFYYPGWQVRVDGESIPVVPSNPEGLLTFDVPAGRHQIAIRFGETPVRLLADAISLLSLAALLFASLFTRRYAPSSPPHPAPLSPSLSLLITALLLVVLKVALIDRVETPVRWNRLREGQLSRVDVPAAVTFDGQFRLLGYDALPQTIAADGSLEVRLYWQDSIPGGPDYRADLALEGEDGLRWNDAELRVPRWHRAPPSSALWPAESYALTAFEMRPLPGTPPGLYTVTMGVFDYATLAPYTAADAADQPLGLRIPLGQVEITRPRRPPAEIDAQYPADAAFGPLRLVGYSLDRTEAAPGDPFKLTLFWRADETPREDLQVQVRLLDPAGLPRLTLDLPPVRADWPTSRWQAGDLWRGQHVFRLPAGLESGAHRWELTLYREEGAPGQPLELGTLQAHAPQRLWIVPPLDIETNARLGNVVTLLGAQLAPCDLPAPCNLQPGTTITVTLVWRAEAEMTTSYRVFLHLLNSNGTLVTQSDGEPANWGRPTTGWLPGEIVLDERQLTIPAQTGIYTLKAGMYILGDGRLVDAAGNDALFLLTLIVEEP